MEILYFILISAQLYRGLYEGDRSYSNRRFGKLDGSMVREKKKIFNGERKWQIVKSV